MYRKLECTCVECGKFFLRGTEGDNETLCLRCERELRIMDMSEEEYEEMDIQESQRGEG